MIATTLSFVDASRWSPYYMIRIDPLTQVHDRKGNVQALDPPIGYTLAWAGGIELPGIWWGLCIGLFVVAAFLVGWIAFRGPARLRRLAID